MLQHCVVMVFVEKEKLAMKSTKRTNKVIFFITIAIFLGIGNKTAGAVNLEYYIVIDDPASH